MHAKSENGKICVFTTYGGVHPHVAVSISQMLRIWLMSRWQAVRLVLRCAQDCRIATQFRNCVALYVCTRMCLPVRKLPAVNSVHPYTACRNAQLPVCRDKEPYNFQFVREREVESFRFVYVVLIRMRLRRIAHVALARMVCSRRN